VNTSRWKHIKQVFEEACLKQESERTGFLDVACASDSELRGEVESLLRSLTESGTFLEPPDMDPEARTALDLNSDHYIGRQVGTYRITKVLGYGGMGAVYEAVRDDGQFQKRVAIKLVRPAAYSKELIERFQQERRALARLEHPNIATLVDGGTTDEGVPYFVMEFVDGIPLDEYCEEKKLSVADRLDLFRLVCAAVQYAHQNLLVHRDIKPGNILVTPNGTPKLLDFGIAKFLNEAHQTEPSEVTRVGLRFITLEYASPEQIKGEPVTTTSDVYSLGVLLYKVLTGRSPYNFKTRLPHEMTRVVCEEQPPKPSTTSKHRPSEMLQSIPSEKLRRQLAGDLDNIILKALQKEPHRRYSSVEQFAEDIRRHREGLPVLARPDTVRYRTAKFVQRHRFAVGAAAVLIIAILGGAAATLWQANKAKKEAAKAEQISNFLQEMLSSADPAKSGKDVTVVQTLDRAVERVERELVLQPEVAASLLHTIGETYLGLGQYVQAERELKKSLFLRHQIFGSEHEEISTVLHSLAFLEQLRGNQQGADSLYQQAIAMYKGSGASLDIRYAAMLSDYSTLLREMRLPDKALHFIQEATEIHKSTGGKDTKEYAVLLTNLGGALQDTRQFRAADSVFRVALELMKEKLGENHIDVAQAINNFAFVLLNENKTAEAESLFRQSLDIRKKVLGENHPEVALALSNLAGIVLKRNDFNEAEQLSLKALNLYRNTVNPDNLRLTSSLVFLGRIENMRGNGEKAERFLTEALLIRRKALPSGHYGILAVEAELGKAYALQHRYNEAEQLLKQAYENLLASMGDKHPATVIARTYLTELYEKGRSSSSKDERMDRRVKSSRSQHSTP
jgi:eukaryotic-like serine/threonine-protein kinase